MNEKEKIGQMLSAYIDGELSDEQTRAMEELLQRQPELAKELRSLQKVRQLIRDLPRAAAPDDLAQKVLAQVARRPHVRLVSIRRFRQLAAAAGILLVIGIGVIITQLTHRTTATKKSLPSYTEKIRHNLTSAPSNLPASAGMTFASGKAVTNLSLIHI